MISVRLTEIQPTRQISSLTQFEKEISPAECSIKLKFISVYIKESIIKMSLNTLSVIKSWCHQRQLSRAQEKKKVKTSRDLDVIYLTGKKDASFFLFATGRACEHERMRKPSLDSNMNSSSFR